jgi:hypothetical protein
MADAPGVQLHRASCTPPNPFSAPLSDPPLRLCPMPCRQTCANRQAGLLKPSTKHRPRSGDRQSTTCAGCSAWFPRSRRGCNGRAAANAARRCSPCFSAMWEACARCSTASPTWPGWTRRRSRPSCAPWTFPSYWAGWVAASACWPAAGAFSSNCEGRASCSLKAMR